DQLLQAFTGRSLKDDPALWQSFKNLRDARNSFVHEGQARIGGTLVDADKTHELVAAAGRVLDWFDALLPEDQRRHPYMPEAGLTIQAAALYNPPAALREFGSTSG